MACTGVTEFRVTPRVGAVSSRRNRSRQPARPSSDSPGSAAALDSRSRPGAQPGVARGHRVGAARLLRPGRRQFDALRLRNQVVRQNDARLFRIREIHRHHPYRRLDVDELVRHAGRHHDEVAAVEDDARAAFDAGALDVGPATLARHQCAAGQHRGRSLDDVEQLRLGLVQGCALRHRLTLLDADVVRIEREHADRGGGAIGR